MTGNEAFEVAAAVAAVFGLGALLALAVLAIVGAWKLFRRASDASLASTRAALSIEELARRLASQPASTPTDADSSQFAELRQQAEAMIEQQRRLQEMANNLFDTEALEGGPGHGALDDLETTVSRLDTTVGEMAATLANLIQSLERQQEGQ